MTKENIDSNQKKILNRIDLIQQQVDQVQLKVFEEKKTKWYKNPSFLLSVIALLSSLYFSIDSILSKKKSSTVGVIKKSIDELLYEEEKLLQIYSNPNIDINSKNSASQNYQAKNANLIDKIFLNLNDDNIDKIEPSLLVNYGRFLLNSGRFRAAYSIFEKSLKMAKDTLTKQVCYRSLANILANKSFSKFDSIKSRDYRIKDVSISKSYSGPNRLDQISRSYELWALDEYFLIGNRWLGNKLIDSAKTYISKLPDFNISKKFINDRLSDTYFFYNDILVLNNLSGEYDLQMNGSQCGTVYISTNPSGVSISADQLIYNKINKKFNGNGRYIASGVLRFEIGIISGPRYSIPGSLILRCEPGKILTGQIFEFGKSPMNLQLTKKSI